MPTTNAVSTAATTMPTTSISRPSAQASTAGSSNLATVNTPTARLMAATVHAMTRDATTAVRSARRMRRLIQTPLMPSTTSMPSTNKPATSSACEDAAETLRSEREQRGLRDRVERQREQRANRGDRPRPAHGDETAEQSALQSGRGNDRVRRGGQHGADVDEGEPEQEHDRHADAGDFEPCRRLPAPRQRPAASATSSTTAPCPSENRLPATRARRGLVRAL